MTEAQIFQKKWVALPPWLREVLKFAAQGVIIFMLYKLLRYTDRHHLLTLGVIGLVIIGQVIWKKYRFRIIRFLCLRIMWPTPRAGKVRSEEEDAWLKRQAHG